MGKVLDGIDTRLAAWIEAQPLFFVSTAPLAADGLVNVSPKGTTGTFRVVDEHTFTYLEFTGSGVETIAHLRENGRICVMFCAFDGGPKIVRLHGTGRVTLSTDPAIEAEIAPFGSAAHDRMPQLRGVITVDVVRVATSCGYAVPRMALVEERALLDDWSAARGPGKLARYREERNATSIDGLPGLVSPARSSPPISTAQPPAGGVAGPAEYARYEARTGALPANGWIRRYRQRSSGAGH